MLKRVLKSFWSSRKARAGLPDDEETFHRLRQAEDAMAGNAPDEALKICDQILEARPGSFSVRFLRGRALAATGRAAEAIDDLSDAVREGALDPELLEWLGDCLSRCGRFAEAEVCFRRVLSHDPYRIVAREHLIELLDRQDRAADVVAELSLAVEYAPERVDWAQRLFDIFQRIGMFDEALRIAQRTQAEYGESFASYFMLTMAHYTRRDMPAAIAAANRALEFNERSADVHLTLGKALIASDRTEEGIAACRRALKLRPDYPEADFHLGLIQLARQKFREGWPLWERRFVMTGYRTKRPAEPRWTGNTLKGRILHVLSEQGLGDEIMYASCFAEIIESARHCIIECEPRLATLFRRSFPAATIYPAADDATKWDAVNKHQADVRIYSTSLPAHLRLASKSFPAHSGYLRSAPDKVGYWRERLAALPGKLKVGISWRGGTPFTFKERRTLDLAAILPIMSIAEIAWVNLQYGDRSEEIEDFFRKTGIQVVDWPEAIDGDYDETAALVSALDLVISVCTSVVHLSGALGRPVWVMAPRVAEWRYGHQGETMPWYPSAKVYRQPAVGDWDSVISSVSEDLYRRLAVVTEKSFD